MKSRTMISKPFIVSCYISLWTKLWTFFSIAFIHNFYCNPAKMEMWYKMNTEFVNGTQLILTHQLSAENEWPKLQMYSLVDQALRGGIFITSFWMMLSRTVEWIRDCHFQLRFSRLISFHIHTFRHLGSVPSKMNGNLNPRLNKHWLKKWKLNGKISWHRKSLKAHGKQN